MGLKRLGLFLSVFVFSANIALAGDAPGILATLLPPERIALLSGSPTKVKAALGDLTSFEIALQRWSQKIQSGMSPEEFQRRVEGYQKEVESLLRFYLDLSHNSWSNTHHLVVQTKIFELASLKVKWTASPRSLANLNKSFSGRFGRNPSAGDRDWNELVRTSVEGLNSDLESIFGRDRALDFKAWLLSDPKNSIFLQQAQMREALFAPWVEQVGKRLASENALEIERGKISVAYFIYPHDSSVTDKSRFYSAHEFLGLDPEVVTDWIAHGIDPEMFGRSTFSKLIGEFSRELHSKFLPKEKPAPALVVDVAVPVVAPQKISPPPPPPLPPHPKKEVELEREPMVIGPPPTIHGPKLIRQDAAEPVAVAPSAPAPEIVSAPLIEKPAEPVVVAPPKKEITGNDLTNRRIEKLEEKTRKFLTEENVELIESALKKGLIISTQFEDIIELIRGSARRGQPSLALSPYPSEGLRELRNLFWRGNGDRLSRNRNAGGARTFDEFLKIAVWKREEGMEDFNRRRGHEPEEDLDRVLDAQDRDPDSRDGLWWERGFEDREGIDAFESIVRRDRPANSEKIFKEDELEALETLWELMAESVEIKNQATRAEKEVGRGHRDPRVVAHEALLARARNRQAGIGREAIQSDLERFFKGQPQYLGLLAAFNAVLVNPEKSGLYLRAHYRQDKDLENPIQGLELPPTFEAYMTKLEELLIAKASSRISPAALQSIRNFYRERGDKTAEIFPDRVGAEANRFILGEKSAKNFKRMMTIVDWPFSPYYWSGFSYSKSINNAMELEWSKVSEAIGDEATAVVLAWLTNSASGAWTYSLPAKEVFDSNIKTTYYGRIEALALEAKQTGSKEKIQALRQALILHFSYDRTFENLDEAKAQPHIPDNEMTGFVFKLSTADDAQILDFVLEAKEFTKRPSGESKITKFFENIGKIKRGERIGGPEPIDPSRIVRITGDQEITPVMKPQRQTVKESDLENLKAGSMLHWIAEHPGPFLLDGITKYRSLILTRILDPDNMKPEYLFKALYEGYEGGALQFHDEAIAALLLQREIVDYLGHKNLVLLLNDRPTLRDVVVGRFEPGIETPAALSAALAEPNPEKYISEFHKKNLLESEMKTSRLLLEARPSYLPHPEFSKDSVNATLAKILSAREAKALAELLDKRNYVEIRELLSRNKILMASEALEEMEEKGGPKITGQDLFHLLNFYSRFDGHAHLRTARYLSESDFRLVKAVWRLRSKNILREGFLEDFGSEDALVLRAANPEIQSSSDRAGVLSEISGLFHETASAESAQLATRVTMILTSSPKTRETFERARFTTAGYIYGHDSGLIFGADMNLAYQLYVDSSWLQRSVTSHKLTTPKKYDAYGSDWGRALNDLINAKPKLNASKPAKKAPRPKVTVIVARPERKEHNMGTGPRPERNPIPPVNPITEVVRQAPPSDRPLAPLPPRERQPLVPERIGPPSVANAFDGIDPERVRKGFEVIATMTDSARYRLLGYIPQGDFFAIQRILEEAKAPDLLSYLTHVSQAAMGGSAPMFQTAEIFKFYSRMAELRNIPESEREAANKKVVEFLAQRSFTFAEQFQHFPKSIQDAILVRKNELEAQQQSAQAPALIVAAPKIEFTAEQIEGFSRIMDHSHKTAAALDTVKELLFFLQLQFDDGTGDASSQKILRTLATLSISHPESVRGFLHNGISPSAVKIDQNPGFAAYQYFAANYRTDPSLLVRVAKQKPDLILKEIKENPEAFALRFLDFSDADQKEILNSNPEIAASVLNTETLVTVMGAREIDRLIESLQDSKGVRAKIPAQSTLGKGLEICRVGLRHAKKTADSSIVSSGPPAASSTLQLP